MKATLVALFSFVATASAFALAKPPPPPPPPPHTPTPPHTTTITTQTTTTPPPQSTTTSTTSSTSTTTQCYVPNWGQCGGPDWWTGCRVCTPPWWCNPVDGIWYSQCQPPLTTTTSATTTT